jgi:alpha-L-arabinofuranosidase
MKSSFGNFIRTVLPSAFLATGLIQGQGAATVTIRADQPGAEVSSNLFGAFFEEINYAGEGGLYAEMVRNRSFYDAREPVFWSLVKRGNAEGTMGVDTANPLTEAIRNSLRLTMSSGTGTVGAGNSGYWGMSLESGAAYNLGLYAMSSGGGPQKIEARLENADGTKVYAVTSFDGLGANWQHFNGTLVSSGTDTNARLLLAISSPGTVWLDVVSLEPKGTFNGRTNGLRPDLAGKVADLHPSFLRFPGGNFIEGFNVRNAVRWKTTIGDISHRPGHFNDSWGYWSSDGLGAYEFFQFCEDTGMEPLYGINAGLMLSYDGKEWNTVPMNQLQPWVQDALDLIEYANGDTNTAWGSRRAADGHPAPFHLKYMEIGNENGGPLFNERYARFYDAIKSKYPDMHLIAPGNWTGGRPWSRPVEIADEHYYDSPATFISYANKYDKYSRDGSKIFVGEYAVTSGFGTYGNLAAALGEAVFMTGLERNSDLVRMASYAPLFANVNGIQWHPDLIYFDGSRSFGTPSYYVQQMFSRNRGNVVLPTSVELSTDTTATVMHGAIGLGSWSTAVEYADLKVQSNGATLYQDGFNTPGSRPWHVFQGDWSAADGHHRQADSSIQAARMTIGDTNWANYTITLRARKTGGSEGFLILFNWLDDTNWTWLNVGGWNNTLTGVEQSINGTKTTLGALEPQTIQPNRWYDIRIELSGPNIYCYVDGRLVQKVNYPQDIYVSSTYCRADKQVILKAVNPCNSEIPASFKITGVDSIASEADVIQLTSPGSGDENSPASPTQVFPSAHHLANAGREFTAMLPANSLSVFRLHASGMTVFTNLSMQLPAIINSGETVKADVRGQKAGSSGSFGLMPDNNHALAFASDNPGVATVDASGNVTGVTGGLARVIATYESQGISATQSVKVMQAPVQLVHEYSFKETAGAVCNDSIGGPRWNATLPSGGNLDGGGLKLSAAHSQYLRLPAGILSNYASVTIDAWATFPGLLPTNCFFFGFGSTAGRDGTNYIFCSPQSGRAAISDGNYSREQNACGHFDASFNSHLHLTVVFNPPEHYISIYTNGMLAGINSDVRVPMNSVRDAFSYVGRSLYPADPYTDMALDEFRIYTGALTADEILEEQRLGPDKLLPAKKYFSER